MIKKSHILALVLVLMTTCAYAETFNEDDVLGDWYAYEIDVNEAVGAYWFYADLKIDSSTDVSGNIYTPDGKEMQITSGTASISPDGALSGTFTTSTGLMGTVVDGLQDQNHSIFGYVGFDSQDSMGLAIGIKSGGSYQTADMAGDWRFYAIEIDPNLPGLYWAFGDGTVEADGTVSSGAYQGPDGTEINVDTGQFSLDSEGKISASFDLEGGLSATVADGMVDVGKTFAVYVDVDNTNRLGFNIALKKGGTYQASDLVGDWKFYNFTIDAANGLAYWVFGSGNIDINGALTGTYTAPDSSEFSISDGQASLSTNGELSGSFTVAGVANETIHSGFMDQNKNIIVFVGSSDNNEFDLGIGFRTSTIQTAQDTSGDGEGGGGGGGGCFIESAMNK